MHSRAAFPWLTWAPILAALALAGAEHAGLFHVDEAATAGLASPLLLSSVFAAVHHAETVAAKVGQPLGSLVLALVVTAIEASLIIAAMTSSGAHETALVRDTVFATVLTVLNGMVGICLLVGGVRHRE